MALAIRNIRCGYSVLIVNSNKKTFRLSGLTWSQEGDDFALHAMPIMHHTNVSQACSMLDGVTAYEASAYEQALAEYDDTATTSDDWDFGVDCGDFMM